MNNKGHHATIIGIIDRVLMDLGLTQMEHFDEEDDMRESWQYDGYDHGNELCVQVVPLINRTKEPFCAVTTDDHDFSGTLRTWQDPEWIETFRQVIKSYL